MDDSARDAATGREDSLRLTLSQPANESAAAWVKAAARECRRLKDSWGVEPYIETLLGDPLRRCLPRGQ